MGREEAAGKAWIQTHWGFRSWVYTTKIREVEKAGRAEEERGTKHSYLTFQREMSVTLHFFCFYKVRVSQL